MHFVSIFDVSGFFSAAILNSSMASKKGQDCLIEIVCQYYIFFQKDEVSLPVKRVLKESNSDSLKIDLEAKFLCSFPDEFYRFWEHIKNNADGADPCGRFSYIFISCKVFVEPLEINLLEQVVRLFYFEWALWLWPKKKKNFKWNESIFFGEWSRAILTSFIGFWAGGCMNWFLNWFSRKSRRC